MSEIFNNFYFELDEWFVSFKRQTNECFVRKEWLRIDDQYQLEMNEYILKSVWSFILNYKYL